MNLSVHHLTYHWSSPSLSKWADVSEKGRLDFGAQHALADGGGDLDDDCNSCSESRVVARSEYRCTLGTIISSGKKITQNFESKQRLFGAIESLFERLAVLSWVAKSRK